MKKGKYESDRRFATVKWNLLLIGIVFSIFAISLVFINGIVEENTRQTGSNIATQYSVEDKGNLQIYRTLLEVGSEYIEVHATDDREELEIWLKNYFQTMKQVVEITEMTPYAAIDGKMVIAVDWEEADQYDVYQTVWYTKAIEAAGEIIFTDAYQDAIYDKPVITVAKACGDTGNVIAFDIYPENFVLGESGTQLPEGACYYVCDNEGNLLYYQGDGDLEDTFFQEDFQRLYVKLQDASLKDEGVHYYNAMGERMEVYCREATSGWKFILSIPHSYLERNWHIVLWLYVVALVISLIALAIMWVRQNVKNNEIRERNKIVQILGNSYYAYYKIDIRKGIYEAIRASDYVSEHLKPRGEYEQLLELFKAVIPEEEHREFCESFSIENINKQLANGNKDFGGDFRRRFDDGYKWVNVRMLFSPSLNKDEMVFCFRMVNDEKLQQLKRMELLEDAVEAANVSERSQKQFFSNISHDMRTPLNVIIGMSELAEKYVDDPQKMQEYLQKINFSSKQLLALINDVLEMSRIEQGLTLENQQFHIEQHLSDCVNIFRTEARKVNKEITFDCTLQHAVVMGDAFRLEQIMNNLMSNALKFTRESDRICVRVREIDSQEHAKFQIIVEDSGMGMSEEFVKNIFVPYEREKRFGNQSIEGTGLGMPIVKNLVSLMGGEITVQSELERGTRFTLVLPFETVANEETVLQESEEAEEKQFDLKGCRVLLAEDYELNMELTTDILEMNGVTVVQAWNGKEALEKFEQSEEFEFDAILMDMQMPEMDGCEAARNIRNIQRADADSVPIIALTANAFSEDIARTLKAGMNAHICKPLDVKVLCDTLQKWMKESTNED